MTRRHWIVLFLLGLAILANPLPVFAEDIASLILQADAAYAKREDLPQAKIAMDTYARAAAEADSQHVVECYWKASRTAWWIGQHIEERAGKLDSFQKGMDFAKKAIQLNPNSVEGHFWLGGNQGSYGEARGVLKSLAMVKPIRREMAEVIRLNDHYLNGGVYHVLGTVDYKVPGFAGGSKKRAREELEKALTIGPLDPFNHYYFAEFYTIIGDKAKAQAEVEILRNLRVAPEDEPELQMLQKKAARGFK